MTLITPAHMSVEEKVGQMVMVRYHDPEILAEMLSKGWAGSFYFSMKGQSPVQVVTELNRLQSLAKVPAMVAFGYACCDFGSNLLTGLMMRLGATRSADLTYRMAYAETSEQRGYGFHIPGLPVLDVNINPDNPIINTRAFGDCEKLVSELGMAALRGIIDARGVTCAMHFPGHGNTSDDSHIRMPVDDRPFEQLWDVDLLPYRLAIPQGLINGICTAHIHYPCLDDGPPGPGTVSRKIITDLLRGKLGYRGVTMSDSLTMKPMKDRYGIEEAAILTVQAGHDIILQDYQSDPRITHTALVDAVKSGRIPLQQVDESVARIMELKQWLGLLDDPLVDPDRIDQTVATPENKALAMEIARRSVTVLENRPVACEMGSPDRCLVIVNGSGQAWNEDMQVGYVPNHERLHRAIRERLPGARTLTLSEEMTGAEMSAALEQAREAHMVVFGLFTRVLSYQEDAIGIKAPYRDLIEQVAGLGKHFVLLSFGNPYIMAHLPQAHGALCTYDEHCPESIEAAVEVLFGETRPEGRLPVRVSDRYGFGHGL
jgi:beta-N-acetylhexosaminidase